MNRACQYMRLQLFTDKVIERYDAVMVSIAKCFVRLIKGLEPYYGGAGKSKYATASGL